MLLKSKEQPLPKPVKEPAKEKVEQRTICLDISLNKRKILKNLIPRSKLVSLQEKAQKSWKGSFHFGTSEVDGFHNMYSNQP